MSKEDIRETYLEIYHYTNFSTALLIIHSKVLYANRFDGGGNDPEEIKYAKERIEEELLKKVEKNSSSVQKAREDLQCAYNIMGIAIYRTSFCGKNPKSLKKYHCKNGLLSMWRGYGHDGGCAIVFKTENFDRKTKQYAENYAKKPNEIEPPFIIDEVIYKGENDDDQNYRESLDRFTNTLSSSKGFEETWHKMEWSEKKKFIEDFMFLLIFQKHQGFYEEREVRLGFISKFGAKEEERTQLLPFHPIRFEPEDIDRIIIGPHQYKKQRCEFLKSFLSERGLDIKVSVSETPFV